MKLMMLGGRGVGKTTLLYAMYGYFHVPRSGLRVKAEDSDSAVELNRGAELLQMGLYPPGTLRRDEYNFNLYHDGDEVFDFSWIDYSGRWLTQQTEAANVAQLRRDLEDCSGLFVFLEAAKFPVSTNIELRQTIQILNATLTRIEQFLPVVFVVTKCDESPRGFDREYYESSLQGVLSNIKQSKTVSGAVVPVCCGRRTQDVDLPLLYFLAQMAFIRHVLCVRFIGEVSEQIGAYDRKGFFGKLWGEFNGTADEHRQQVQAAMQVMGMMKKLQETIESMSDRLGLVNEY